MNKEVEKLVEKVADIELLGFYDQMGCPIKYTIGKAGAKQILSENNLALIVGEELPEYLTYNIGFPEFEEFNSMKLAHSDAQQAMLKAGWKPVIILAEELKE